MTMTSRARILRFWDREPPQERIEAYLGALAERNREPMIFFRPVQVLKSRSHGNWSLDHCWRSAW